jgi:menaquinone-9 beta-reductase
VTLVEATTYPRHRVCGEFISGLSDGNIAELGLEPVFAHAKQHRSTGWYEQGRRWVRAELPNPAYGLSRYVFDQALAEQFIALGGELRCGTRHEGEGEGVVWATGRIKSGGEWLGLKAHYEGLPLSDDLEIHLGDGGYVGLTAIESGQVNVCGLFRQERTGGADVLAETCVAAGLPRLAARLKEAQMVPGTLKGVTHFQLGWQPAASDRVSIGDAAALIPPFTGNGMSMAVQGALLAADPLAEWSRGERSWCDVRARVSQDQQRVFGRRLRWARAIQAIMLRRTVRRLALGLVSSGLLRFDFLYTKLR